MICKGRKADKSIKLRIPRRKDGSQNVGAKLHVREGKSPDHKLRSLNLPDVKSGLRPRKGVGDTKC